ncbi:hypothetical protein GUJ93_ZPchr0007g4671 [Zizania palustris]|uniref:Cysteine-rich receptor-like protein kinase 10 n=1 Tax=Zizania palustris TaxID=103762 RepID=A0A8J5TD29_ZIZPA|nr:hypothetical protein GUJ93_ZPchr0007g4671 [Zizania palustris]
MYRIGRALVYKSDRTALSSLRLLCLQKCPMACLSIAIVAVALLVARTAGQPWTLCGDDFGTFTAKSSYLASLNLIAGTLPRNASASPDLYATAVDVGAVPEQVSAAALCRGDVTAKSCLSCLTQAFANLQSACTFNKDATLYDERCMLHYSDIHFLSDDDSPPIEVYTINNNNVVKSDPARYNRIVAALVNATADYAAYNSTRRYASGEADFNQEFPKVYSWAQCTPDLTPARCRSCLAQIIATEIGSYKDSIGSRTLSVKCSFRIETAPFLNGAILVRLPGPSASSPARAPAPAVPAVNGSPATSDQGTKYNVPRLVPIILLPIIASINLMVCICVWRRRRPVANAKHTSASNYAETEDIDSVDSMLIDISTLRAATGDFAESNKLGEGGFGAVYKGVLPNGNEIAVKRLSKSSAQGVGELKNELALVAKLKHKNLVSLVGVCLEEQERLLVYEFVPNRSLDLFLFETEKREKVLDWQMRIFGRDQTQAVTNRVVGTYGYMAPEYMLRGNYSVKSDAFSFGVMVLEIVTGRKNNDFYNSQQSEDLLTTVWEHWTGGAVAEMVDPTMNGDFSETDARKCIHVALLCVQGNPADRPVMSSVVMMLGSETASASVNVPSKPAFFARNGGGGVAESDVASGESTASVHDRSYRV